MSAGSWRPANLQTAWARLLMVSFADAGVEDVVVSPGSRSTPFVAAALEEARLRLFDLVDERSAGFFALGRSKVTERPTLLLCTSGSAGAHYFPAILEAEMSATPLLVLTADRPLELASCGANQTIDQLKLFGDHVRAFFELGLPEASDRGLRALRRVAFQAVSASGHPQAGPVHLNARAGKPLEPRAAVSPDEERLHERVESLLTRPGTRAHRPASVADAAAVAALARRLAEAERGVIVCGPAPLSHRAHREAVWALAARSGWPVLAEATSQVRFRGETAEPATVFVDAFDLLLRSPGFRAAHRPRLILQIGRPPLSGGFRSYVEESPDCPRWIVADGGWPDPVSSASDLLYGDVGVTLDALHAELDVLGCRRERSRSGWLRSFAAAEAAAWEVVEGALDASDGLGEGAVARETVEALPRSGLLALGNSLPVRHADLYCRGRGVEAAVLSQRGVSGIDGLVSGVAGAAAACRLPTALLIGDLSFLHDVGGLAAFRYVEGPFVAVVVQNRGGRIFEQLPLAEDPAIDEDTFEHWTTPHDLSFSELAEMFSLRYAAVETRRGLRRALHQSFELGEPTILEAVVEPHGAAEQDRQLRGSVEAALAELE